jgi:hypothetical protein
MANILIKDLTAGTPLFTDLLIFANPTTGLAKKTTITEFRTQIKYRIEDLADVVSPFAFQSVLTYEDGMYKDVMVEAPQTEQTLIAKFSNQFGLTAKKPDGSLYGARNFQNIRPQAPLATISSITNGDGVAPTGGFVNGTMPASNQIIINGISFGSSVGSLQFSNVNDGGATNTSTVADDIIYWTDNQIRAKIPGLAGFGTLRVLDDLGNVLATTPITIKWGEINVSNTFSGFGTATRQQVHLMKKNSEGGYTFEFSSSTTNGPAFSANASAKLAFQRAIRTWRCSTLVNYNVNILSASNAQSINDDINIIVYDNTLTAGALAVCTSRFSGNSTGLCNLYNTVWQLKEMDIRVLSVPLTNFTWNYSSIAPTSSQFDFESVILHEIGHGHGLTHVSNPSSSLMFYSISNGIVKRLPTANEIEGGQFKIARSVTNCLFQSGNTDFSPHTAISPAECSFLIPIRLLDFSGQQTADQIQLQWSTEWEQNAKGFMVEKSIDGRNFSDVDFVLAKGNSANIQTYQLTDLNTSKVSTIYYRLKLLDKDGKFSYSKVISFKPGKASWKIFPNPANNTVSITAQNEYSRGLTVQITDIAGRLLKTQPISALQQGETVNINISLLAKGIYQMKFLSNEQVVHTEKLIKE